MSNRRVLGLLATHKSGLTALRESGQDERFIRFYLKHYAAAFDRVYYFSHQDEKLEHFTQDPDLLRKIILLPKRWPIPALFYSVLLPLAYWKEFGQCQVFRVYQAMGVIPLWRAAFTHQPSLITFGYEYLKFARIEKKAWWQLAFTALREWMAIRMATVMLVTTQELAASVGARRGRKPIALIPNGVDTTLFSATLRSEREVSTLLFIGRLERQKNLDSLLTAAKIVHAQRPIRLLWIGKGSLENELRQRAAEIGLTLEIRPPIAHGSLPLVLKEADVFTLVSWSEGHPKVLLEAMSAALPCVVSNCNGNRAIIESGKTGLLCNPANPEEMAATILQMLASPSLAQELGHNARSCIQTHYELSSLVKREVELLVSLIHGE
jgi:glycosyltransferase involved in cell wall biosynthesis